MKPMMVTFGGVIFALNIVPAVMRAARNVNNKHRGRPHSRNRFEGHEKGSCRSSGLITIQRIPFSRPTSITTMI